jgi:hypothetical protein
MNRRNGFAVLLAFALLSSSAASSQAPSAEAAKAISAEDCTSERLGTTIPASAIGEPVAGVSLAAPKWVSAGNVMLRRIARSMARWRQWIRARTAARSTFVSCFQLRGQDGRRKWEAAA